MAQNLENLETYRKNECKKVDEQAEHDLTMFMEQLVAEKFPKGN